MYLAATPTAVMLFRITSAPVVSDANDALLAETETAVTFEAVSIPVIVGEFCNTMAPVPVTELPSAVTVPEFGMFSVPPPKKLKIILNPP